MSKIVILFATGAIALYFLAAFRLGSRLLKGAPATHESKRLPIALGMGAATFHALVLTSTVSTPHGLNFSFFNAVSLLSWLVATLTLVVAMRKPVENLAIAILPLAGMSVLSQLIFPKHEYIPDDLTVGLNLHILISVLAFGVLNIAAIQAALLAIQNKQLRNRHPGGFVRGLPPLETMERLLFQIIAWGFALQTLSLASGFAFLKDMFAQHMVHKTVLAITAWAVYAILLFGRWRFGWRGKVAIRWTIGGFIALLLAYVGSKLVLELVLGKQ